MADSKNEKVYSALEVAKICGVVNQTAINWIKAGYLKAFCTPGGQYRVYPEDLADFMTKRNMKLPEEFNRKDQFEYRLLIVDDDKGLNCVMAKYISKNCGNLNLKIFQAFDGFEAGVLVLQEKPDVILLDLDLPGVDGLSLCKKIRQEKQFGSPRVVVETALEDDEMEKNLSELGVDAYFKKPLNLKEVAEAVLKNK